MSTQLHMIWPKGQQIKNEKMIRLPENYKIRTFQLGDQQSYLNLMKETGFDWSQKKLEQVIHETNPLDIFFVIHIPNNEIVATAMSCKDTSEFVKNSTQLGWVACSTNHSKQGLGFLVCKSVVENCLEKENRNIYLKTDDYRIPAIKTYLNLGFEPINTVSDTKTRWNKVMDQINTNLTSTANDK